jgi:hypothetical protein
MTGMITEWNDANGRGLITGDPPDSGTYFVSRSRCTPRLQAVLKDKAIPPDPPVPVKFDVDLQGNAINVDLR